MAIRTGIKVPKLIRSILAIGIIFLLIMSLLRVALFVSFSKQGNHFSDLLPAFWLGVRFDLRYIGILLTPLLILGSIPALHPLRTSAGRKLALILTGLAGFLVVFFYSVDFAHYSYLSQRLNGSVLNYLVDVRISAGMVWQTYPVLRIILLLIAGTWLIVRIVKGVYNNIGRNGEEVKSVRPRVAWFIGLFLVLALAIFGRIGQFPLRWSDAFTLGSDYKANLALNPLQSFFSSLKFRHSVYDEAKVKEALPVLAPYFGFSAGGIAPGALAGVGAIAGSDGSGGAGRDALEKAFVREVKPREGALTSRPNVVVVICESFSGYKSSMWGNPLNTTPFFDSMCRAGVFFDHCFTPTYGTARGVWAVITGIPDVEVATTTSSRNPSAVDQHTIINNFTGYDKFYFLGGSTSWANIRGLLTNNIEGLHLYEQENYTAPKIDVWGISDKNLFLEANKVLKQQKDPFFAVIQTADNHRPYTIPEEDRQAFHPVTVSQDSLRKCGFESNEEMNAFRYTDFGYRTFIEAASKEKYFDNTVFLFVGDHGIPGDAGNMFPRAWTDQRLSAEHVPLLLYAPKLLAPKRVTSWCSQVDVLPTLAGVAGISYTNTTLGRDLLGARLAGQNPSNTNGAQNPSNINGAQKPAGVNEAQNPVDTVHGGMMDLSFIYDPDLGYIGVVQGGYFYRRQLKTGQEEMVSVLDNNPVPDAVRNGAVKKNMAALADGIYETARFMILKNKK